MRNYTLYIIIAAVISVVLIVMLIWPRYEDLSSLKLQILGREAELRIQDEHFQELQQIFQQIEENKESLAKIDSALPSEPSITELLNFFQKTASESNLLLKEISPSPSVRLPDKDIKLTIVDTMIEGSYSGFKDYISGIEKSARLIRIQRISFSYPEREESFIFEIQNMVHSY